MGRNYLFVWGGELINERKKKTIYIVALDGHRLKYFHTTTNQKHAAGIDNGTKESANGEEWGRSAIPSFWGQSSWEGIKK